MQDVGAGWPVGTSILVCAVNLELGVQANLLRKVVKLLAIIKYITHLLESLLPELLPELRSVVFNNTLAYSLDNPVMLSLVKRPQEVRPQTFNL